MQKNTQTDLQALNQEIEKQLLDEMENREDVKQTPAKRSFISWKFAIRFILLALIVGKIISIIF